MKNSGMTKQKKSVHIQATRSSSLICEFDVTPDSVFQWNQLKVIWFEFYSFKELLINNLNVSLQEKNLQERDDFNDIFR